MWRSFCASTGALISYCSPAEASVLRVSPRAEVLVADSVTAEVFAFVSRCALRRTCACIWVECDGTRCTTAQTQNRTRLLFWSGFVLLVLQGLYDTCPV